MSFDNRQLTLQGELESRLKRYWKIRDTVGKQMIFAPKSTRAIMSELIYFIDNTAMPKTRRLLDTIGLWDRADAQDFYQANQEVCRLTDLLNYDAQDEDIQTWQNPRNF